MSTAAELSELPERIGRNLDPTEKPKIYHRFHWAVMLRPVAVVIVGVFVSAAVDVVLPTKGRNAHVVAWVLWGLWLLWTADSMFDLRKTRKVMLSRNRNYTYAALVLVALAAFLVDRLDKQHHFGAGGVLLIVLTVVVLWAFSQYAEWHERYFVLTNKRIVVIEGILTTTVRSMPVSRLTDMAYRRTALGRALGYGLFDVESAGQDQALKIMDFVRDPENVNLQISSLLFGSVAPKPKNIALDGVVEAATGAVIIKGQMDG